MSNELNLRDGLHNAEPLNEERQAQFEAELNLILEPQLPASHRIYYKLCLTGMAFGLFGSVCGVAFDAQNRLINLHEDY